MVTPTPPSTMSLHDTDNIEIVTCEVLGYEHTINHLHTEVMTQLSVSSQAQNCVL